MNRTDARQQVGRLDPQGPRQLHEGEQSWLAASPLQQADLRAVKVACEAKCFL
jgi:hypothetical protein